MRKLLFCLFPLIICLASCKPPVRPYQSGNVSVNFPGDFEVRESDTDSPAGKVHKVAAVCSRANADYAVITTTYPAALVAPYSDATVLKKELDLDLRTMGATLTSSQLDTNGALPCLDFTFSIPSEIKGRAQGTIYYHNHKSYLISALYVKRTHEVAAFLNSILLLRDPP